MLRRARFAESGNKSKAIKGAKGVLPVEVSRVREPSILPAGTSPTVNIVGEEFDDLAGLSQSESLAFPGGLYRVFRR